MAAKSHASGMPAPKILVVDDDMDIRETLVQLLEFEGFAVACASNGQEALKHLETDRPDLILLDLMMPVMSGYEFRKVQRVHPELADIPVVILSADGNVRQKAEASDVCAYLKKPIELDILLETIRANCRPSRP